MTSDNRSLSEIGSELDKNRERLGRTLDVLQSRLSTEDIADRGRRYLRNSGSDEFVANLSKSVRRNPIPLSLLGVGIGWLMLSSSDRAGRMIERNTPDFNRGDSSNHQRSGTGDAAASVGQRAKSAASDMSQHASEATDAGKKHIGQAADRAQRSAAYVTDGARRGASRLGNATRRGSTRLFDGADYMYREQPLITTALGLAIGGIVAASLPRGRYEDRVAGAASDDLVASAWEAGHEKAGQAQSVAESAAHGAKEAAKSEAEKQGVREHKDKPTSPSDDTNR